MTPISRMRDLANAHVCSRARLCLHVRVPARLRVPGRPDATLKLFLGAGGHAWRGGTSMHAM
eukprot:666440-Alexandrium_andersonii.AAC.1